MFILFQNKTRKTSVTLVENAILKELQMENKNDCYSANSNWLSDIINTVKKDVEIELHSVQQKIFVVCLINLWVHWLFK